MILTVTKANGEIKELKFKKEKVSDIEIKSLSNIMLIKDIPKFKIPYNTKIPKISGWQYSKTTDVKPTKKTNVGLICSPRTGICAIDLDFYTKKGEEPYDPINNPKHKIFIDKFGKDFIKRFNTYSQSTPNGGIHLVFQHHKDIQQTSNKSFKIDIRGGSTNGQIILAGSCYDDKPYTILNNTDIKPLPLDLLEYLKDNIFKKKTKETTIKKSKVNYYEGNYNYKYSYNVPKDHIEIILDELNGYDSSYYTDRSNWLILTSAMKQIGHKTAWDYFSKLYGGTTYNKFNNFREWDNITLKDNRYESSFYFEKILEVAQMKDNLKLYRFLKLPTEKHNNLFSHINIDKLSKELDLNTENKFWCIRSDTGTGKTTLFKQLIKDIQCEVISITSRTCLAYEQCEDFRKIATGDCNFYQFVFDDENAQVQTICIDSLLKIAEWDFSNKVIFLDEFNSIVEYLISCDTSTLSINREEIFELLIDKILMEAKGIVCVDADICDLSIEYLKALEEKRNIKFKYIENDYLHNKDNKITEVHEHDHFISKISQEEMWLMPCDSKEKAKALYEELTKIDSELYPDREPIILIIAEDKSKKAPFIRLDEHKRVIYSPKIVYGLDSNGYGTEQLPRPVFAYYNMKSISPKAMMQQICRERKITHLYILIYSKIIRNDVIKDEIDFYDEIKKQNKHALKLFDRLSSSNNSLFVKLLNMYKYKENCYITNKYLHLINLLKERGWKITNDYLKYGERTKAMTDKNKELINKYNDEQYTLQDHLHSKLNRELFKFETEKQLEPYKHYFTDAKHVIKHYALIKLLFTTTEKLQTNLDCSNDFSIVKLTNTRSKHLFIRKILDIFGLDTKFNKVSEPKDFKNCDIINEYKTIWQDRTTQPIELKTLYDKQKFIAKIYERLKIPLTKKRTLGEDKKKVINYKINEDAIEECTKIAEYSKYDKELDFFND